MAKITYSINPYTNDEELPHSPAVTHHCPGCERLRAELLACCELHERSMMIIEEALGPDRPNGGTWRAQQIANEIIALRNFIAMDKEATTGERIRQMRLARGMTQDQISSAAGISKGFLSDVENGKRDISSRNLLRIATALSASVDYLLQGVFCPGCEAVARELADIAAVLRTGSSGDTLLGKEVSRWIDTAHGAEQERDDLHTLCDKQADILSRVAIALRGPEPPQTKWSHHDLPERAAKIKQEIAHLRAGILRVIEGYTRAIKQDAEEALRALADGVAAPMSSNSDLWAHPIICACGDHIGYTEEIGLSQDGAVCGNCATSRKDYDARTELATLRAGIAEVLDMYPQSIEQGPQDELRDLLRKDAK